MNAEQNEALRKAKHFFRLAMLGASTQQGMRMATALLLAARFLAEAREAGTPEEELILMDEDYTLLIYREEVPVWEAVATAIETLSLHVEPQQPARVVPRMGGEPGAVRVAAVGE